MHIVLACDASPHCLNQKHKLVERAFTAQLNTLPQCGMALLLILTLNDRCILRYAEAHLAVDQQSSVSR